MGKRDIQVVPIPQKQLQDWWDRMSKVNQQYVRERVGYLLELINIEPRTHFIQALIQFWDVETATFMFRRREHELTPTLEEYRVAIGVDFDKVLVKPPVGLQPVNVLAEFLAYDLDKTQAILNSNMGRFPLQFLVDRYSDLPSKMSARVFILAFFGFVLFPCSRTTFDPLVTSIARQACYKLDYSNMLLAETVLSLNKCQRGGKNLVFKASAGLLSMWFFSHLRQYERHMLILEMDRFTHPLQRFSRFHKSIPKNTFHQWSNFMVKLSADQLQWRAPWPKFLRVQLTSTEGNMVPLLGFNGGTAYCPLRVTRQFGIIQDIPPPWSPEVFSFMVPRRATSDNEKRYLQERVSLIVRALKESPRQAVIWPGEMEGEMKLYWATQDYIRFVRERRDADDDELIDPFREEPFGLIGAEALPEGRAREEEDREGPEEDGAPPNRRPRLR